VSSRGSDVCLAWTGTDHRLNLAVSSNGRDFSDTRTLPFKSVRYDSRQTVNGRSRETVAVAPALAVRSDGICFAWTGTDRYLQLVRLLDDESAAPVRLEETSPVGPALAYSDGELVLAWTGTDRHLNVAVARDGSVAAAVRLPETSLDTPSVAARVQTWCWPGPEPTCM
jgi:hypothetical protein